MADSLEKVCKALKLKAIAKPNVLTLKHGLRKYLLPYEVRILTSEKYMFVHVLPNANVFRFEGTSLSEVTDASEAKEAVASFRTSRKTSKKRTRSAPEIPSDLQAALAKIPAGHKLAVDRDGSVRIVKKRPRRK